tara:strand:+ start:4669 stop:4881 length:213 start_codon:yes stop_codon:yes gene_type:complete
MQKIVNGIAIFSGVVALGVVGLGGYVFIRKDALIDAAKEKIVGNLMGGVTDALPSLPDATGPAVPQLPSF